MGTVRSTMAELIDWLRDAIADQSGTTQVWSNEQLQAALDRNRVEHRYSELYVRPTIAQGGSVSYKVFYAADGYWESDAVLYSTVAGTSFVAIPIGSTDTADYLGGRWSFATTKNWPMYIVGFSYDVNIAAAEVLDRWVAKVKLDFDFSADGQTLQRSQKAVTLKELADHYRGLGKPEVIQMVRTD